MDWIHRLLAVARLDFAKGSDNGFYALLQALRGQRRKWTLSMKDKYHSLDLDEIDAIYVEVLYRIVVGDYCYNLDEFTNYFYRSFQNGVVDVARSVIRYKKRFCSFDKLVEEEGETPVRSIVPRSVSAEQEYLSGLNDDDRELKWVAEKCREHGITGDHEIATVAARYMHGVSFDEIPEISEHYRNKQQAWRAVTERARKHREANE